MKKTLILASLVGFLVPVFWEILGLMLFNVRDGRWFWTAVYVTCPFFYFPSLHDLLPGGDLSFPFLTALLYALVAFIFLKLRGKFKSRPLKGIRARDLLI